MWNKYNANLVLKLQSGPCCSLSDSSRRDPLQPCRTGQRTSCLLSSALQGSLPTFKVGWGHPVWTPPSTLLMTSKVFLFQTHYFKAEEKLSCAHSLHHHSHSPNPHTKLTTCEKVLLILLRPTVRDYTLSTCVSRISQNVFNSANTLKHHLNITRHPPTG